MPYKENKRRWETERDISKESYGKKMLRKKKKRKIKTKEDIKNKRLIV